MIDRADPSSVRITVYHACATGATGSALGPRNRLAYWWADHTGAIRVVLSGQSDPAATLAVQEAVAAHLGSSSAADRIRAAQDAAADAVD